MGPCKHCFYGQRQLTTADLQKVRICGRFPPNIPMPAGPGGRSVIFQQPFVSDDTECGEFKSLDTSMRELSHI